MCSKGVDEDKRSRRFNLILDFWPNPINLGLFCRASFTGANNPLADRRVKRSMLELAGHFLECLKGAVFFFSIFWMAQMIKRAFSGGS